MSRRRSTLPDSFSDYFDKLQQRLDDQGIWQAIETRNKQVGESIAKEKTKLFSGVQRYQIQQATSKEDLDRVEREQLVAQKLNVDRQSQRMQQVCAVEFERSLKLMSKSPHERTAVAEDPDRAKQAVEFVKRIQQQQHSRRIRLQPNRSLQPRPDCNHSHRRRLRNVLPRNRKRNFATEENPEESTAKFPGDSFSMLTKSAIRIVKKHKLLPRDQHGYLSIRQTVDTTYMQQTSRIRKRRPLPPLQNQWTLSKRSRTERQQLDRKKEQFLQHLRLDIVPQMRIKPSCQAQPSSIQSHTPTNRQELLARGNSNMKQANKVSVKYQQLPHGISYEKINFDSFEHLLSDDSKSPMQKLNELMTRSSLAEHQLEETRALRKHLPNYDPARLDDEYIGSVRAKLLVLSQVL